MRKCVFCDRIVRGEYDETATASVVRFEPLNPVTPGHMLFIPKAHREHKQETAPLAVSVCMGAAETHGLVQGEQFNLVTSSGRAATQTIPHVHIHYIPRRPNDGLHLPWTGQKH